MEDELKPQEIKRIRGKYGLSQQAFARLLGLGEASVARYENGQKPTKANANLIRAADYPIFMLDCLDRYGDTLTAAQHDKTERMIYAQITLDENGDVMDINQIYEITLQQEILNEQAAQYLGELSRRQLAAEKCGDTVSAMIYDDARMQIARAKGDIIDEEHSNQVALAELRGQIEGVFNFVRLFDKKVA